MILDRDNGLTPAQIAAMAVPTSLIWGSIDHDGGSLTATEQNLHHPPLHIIPGPGHLTMLADPAPFASAVEAATHQ